MNAPNAIPWILLLIVVCVACKREFVGALLLILIGVASSFILYKSLFTPVGVSFLLVLFGTLLLIGVRRA